MFTYPSVFIPILFPSVLLHFSFLMFDCFCVLHFPLLGIFISVSYFLNPLPLFFFLLGLLFHVIFFYSLIHLVLSLFSVSFRYILLGIFISVSYFLNPLPLFFFLLGLLFHVIFFLLPYLSRPLFIFCFFTSAKFSSLLCYR